MDMKQPAILKSEEIQEKLKEVPGWKYENDKLSKEFTFEHFMDSLDFINALAPFFESMDHHPDTHIMYSTVLFELQRFDMGNKVTDRDFAVAAEIDRKYDERKAH